MSDDESETRPDRASESSSNGTERPSDRDDLLAVLAAEYTTEILAALSEDPVPAREIAESSGASRPTVYRRLNRLEAIGAVETTTVPSPGGQRRKVFRLALEEVEVSLTSDADAVEDENRQAVSGEAASRKIARASR
ncbi:ArsR/SmtB family transcription factor [Natrinema caseinilyticum]|uniref:ArsR/SmtB family transcription factor n=1 Tax=Natrinema caseinilyticum TaxID=2961570 RepID=UPI0020C5A050|nr:winged helix-turn-helix domain-containing protein [Natrinema caseinilyticum]